MRTFKEYVDIPVPTKEMTDWFITRTNNHINLVKRYANRVAELNDDRFHGIKERVINHDQSKFKEPEFTPYVFITWSYYCKKRNIDFEVPEVIKSKMNDATIHHIMNNRHHPEGHDPVFDPDSMFNSNNRDSIPQKMVNAEHMETLDLIELVCDWCAVSEENGGNPKDWADKNVNKRWRFTDDQVKLMYELFDRIFD